MLFRSIAVFILGAFCTLSFGPLKEVTFLEKNIFGMFDHLTASYLMPIGALLMTIFLGWYYPKTEVKTELLNNNQNTLIFKLYYFILKYMAPIAMIVILLSGFFK